MGLGTIPARTNGQTIADTWFNVIRTALGGDVVPRDSNGVVGDLSGSLGTTSYTWLYAYLQKIYFKASTSGNYATLKAISSLAANLDFTLPATLPGSGTSAMSIDSTGQMGFFGVTGIIVPYGGSSTPPTGWLLCDGSQVSRTTYANLFAVIGTNFGSGNGTTTFHLPDARGRFIRIVDGGAGRDPDAASRTAMNSGGLTGDNVGSVQTGAVESHRHSVEDTFNSPSGGGSKGWVNATSGGGTYAVNSAYTGGNETRPTNFNAYAIIKT